MSAFVRCPECGGRIRLDESGTPPGKRAQCAFCGAIFRMQAELDDEFLARPLRKGDRSPPKSHALLIGLLVGGGVLLVLVCAGVGFGLFWALSRSRPVEQPTPAPIADAEASSAVRPGTEEQQQDYAEARTRFQTKLAREGPAPQAWEPVKPPAGCREIEYTSGNLALKAWISDPLPADKPRPAVLFLHGGFAFAKEDWEMAKPLRDAGFVVMTPILRGENGLPGNHSQYYDEVDDVLAAAEALSRTPGVDPKRLYVAGHSDGGTLTLLAAMTSKRFRAASSFSASPTQNSNILFGMGRRENAPYDSSNRRELQMRSPLAFARSFKCPVRMYYGSIEFGLSSDTIITAQRAQKAGLDVEAIRATGDHMSSVAPAMRECIAFFQQL